MLNDNETTVLKAVADQIMECTSGQFGFLSDCQIVGGLSRNQMKGYFSQLVQKGFIYVDDSFDQVKLTDAGLGELKEAGYTFLEFDTVGPWRAQ